MVADARQSLGITVDEFWQLTPRDLEAHWKAFERHQGIWNGRIGVIASLLYNANRKKNSRAIEPHEWFGKGGGRKIKRQSAAEINSAFDSLAALLNPQKAK